MIERCVTITIPREATDAQYEKACEMAWAFTYIFDVPVKITRPYGITYESRPAIIPFGVSTEGAAWAADEVEARS